MKWNNLKEMKCPSCDGAVQKIHIGYQCSKCHFKISREKFDGLVEKLYHPQRAVDMRKNAIDENLETLNNFGRKPLTEDFSDSPFLDL